MQIHCLSPSYKKSTEFHLYPNSTSSRSSHALKSCSGLDEGHCPSARFCESSLTSTVMFIITDFGVSAGYIPAVLWQHCEMVVVEQSGSCCSSKISFLNSSVGHEKDFTASEAERSLLPVCAGIPYQISSGESHISTDTGPD